MRSIIMLFCVLGLAVILSACAANNRDCPVANGNCLPGYTQVPRQAGFPYTTQQKLQSVSQWQLIAKDAVQKLVVPMCSPQFPTKPIFVDRSDHSPFGRAFYTYIVTDLANKHIPMLSTPSDATVLKWGTQIVFNCKPPIEWPGVIPGTFELVVDSLFGSAIIPTCPPPSELILTVQVGNARTTANYYINPSDAYNYGIRHHHTHIDN